MTKLNLRWIILVALLIILFSIKDNAPLESVAAIEGEACNKDTDCPCWGKYNATAAGGTLVGEEAEAFGIGVATCDIPEGETAGTCDITFCLDVEPTGVWIRDNPWKYLRENPMITVVIVGLLIMVGIWPKQ